SELHPYQEESISESSVNKCASNNPKWCYQRNGQCENDTDAASLTDRRQH
ncbi:33236_t:CDS:1, partial [Racocetra persica]